MNIRPETLDDIPAIYDVNKSAFDGGEAEARLVDAVRGCESFIPGLSLVAEEEGRVAGHILFSRIWIEMEEERLPAIALAPMAVRPEFQNQGIGSALIRRGLEECRRLGETIVIVLGHKRYYPRFGFSPELAKGIECPFGDVGEAWMALELVPGALGGMRGRAVYLPAFEGV